MGAFATAAVSQSFFLPKPTFTEKELPDQTGRVHLITGGYGGVGEELVKILYSKNATIYVAGRSQSKAEASLDRVKKAFPDSKGRLEFISLDLADLSTIKKSADEFKSRETRLDTLTNNAGVMATPPKSKTPQGHEMQLGTNCLGPWLFTHHLLPLLQRTAAEAPKNSVRVTWAASLATWYSPKNGVDFDAKTQQPKIGPIKDMNYGQSKAGNIYMASEFAKRYGKDGIVSVSWNPGNLRTELTRHSNFVKRTAMHQLMHPAKYGAYTELYAGFSPDITLEDGGIFIAPWGRKFKPRSDIEKGLKDKSEGGTGVAAQFRDWLDKETKEFQ